jgi:hypothetical protein
MSSKDLKIRKRHVAHMHGFPQWRGHLDEAFVRIIVTDRLRAYSAAMVEIRVADRPRGPTQVHNQFNQERHLVTRQVYKRRRSAALAEWRALAA